MRQFTHQELSIYNLNLPPLLRRDLKPCMGIQDQSHSGSIQGIKDQSHSDMRMYASVHNVCTVRLDLCLQAQHNIASNIREGLVYIQILLRRSLVELFCE